MHVMLLLLSLELKRIRCADSLSCAPTTTSIINDGLTQIALIFLIEASKISSTVLPSGSRDVFLVAPFLKGAHLRASVCQQPIKGKKEASTGRKKQLNQMDSDALKSSRFLSAWHTFAEATLWSSLAFSCSFRFWLTSEKYYVLHRP